MKKQPVVVEAWVPGVKDDAHPEHPIYIPIVPPLDLGLHPEHPIYFPVGIWGGGNEPMPTPPIYIPIEPPSVWPGVPAHPIYWPVYIEHPIVLPPDQDLSDEFKEKLLDFLTGNLPEYVAPH